MKREIVDRPARPAAPNITVFHSSHVQLQTTKHTQYATEVLEAIEAELTGQTSEAAAEAEGWEEGIAKAKAAEATKDAVDADAEEADELDEEDELEEEEEMAELEPAATEAEKKKKGGADVDCQLGEWAVVKPCATACGETSVAESQRPVLVEPQGKGAPCGPLSKVETCPAKPCAAESGAEAIKVNAAAPGAAADQEESASHHTGLYLVFAGGVGAVLVAAAFFHFARRPTVTAAVAGSFYQPPEARFAPLNSPAARNVPDDYDRYSRITYGHN